MAAIRLSHLRGSHRLCFRQPERRAHTNAGSCYSQHDGGDGEELARGGELHAVVHLLPVREQAGLALVRGLERRPFDRVEQEVHALEGERHSPGVITPMLRVRAQPKRLRATGGKCINNRHS